MFPFPTRPAARLAVLLLVIPPAGAVAVARGQPVPPDRSSDLVVTPLEDGEYRADINGIRHWYRIAAAEEDTIPLVIVHGGPGGNVYSFERTIGPRLEQFSTVIYYAQRGSGRSAAPEDPEAYSIPLLVSDLEFLRIRIGPARINLLGFSFGGELALEYALAYPERVNKLILQSPTTGNWRHLYRVQLRGFQAVTSGAMGRQVRAIAATAEPLEKRYEEVWSTVDAVTVDDLLFYDEAAARLNRKLQRESGLINTGQMFRALRKHTSGPRLRDRARDLPVPTLVLVGLHDRNVGVDAVRDLASALPQGCLALFEESAHFPDIEEPAKYAGHVQRFLADRGADSCK